jgi:2-(3-amino-3-carboxypropyl)histidine synthase
LKFEDSFSFFVQIACPRLSIDWGTVFKKPLLNSYEFFSWVRGHFSTKGSFLILLIVVYYNDFYSQHGGEWANYYHTQPYKRRKINKHKIEIELE